MITLAIDPGANGAFAVSYPDGSVSAHKFTSESDFLDSMQELATQANLENLQITAFVEQVGGFVGKAQPGSAMFNFGRNFGFILGTCQALRFQIILIPPQRWQKLFPTSAKKNTSPTLHKRQLKDHAARLFPQLKVTLANADALLMLHYALSSRP